MSSSLKKISVIFTLVSLILPSLTQALEVDYNHILSDAEAEDKAAMSQAEIKSFLSSQNSYLTNIFS